jgi:Uma2 family endonuclease
MGALPLKEDYTYADYLEWDLKEGERYEIIDGVPYAMAAPSIKHQRIAGRIYSELSGFLKGKPCEAFIAPLDVCLFGKGNFDKNYVQPDVFVVCDKSKIEERRCNGAPDLVVEVLSPSTEVNDFFCKLNKYRQAGVREYWIVDPRTGIIQVCILENSYYITKDYTSDDIIPVTILDGCKINMKEVFAE